MSTNPYVISCASYTEGCDGYLATLQNLKNFNWISVEFKPHLNLQEGQLPTNWIRIALTSPYPGHLKRWQVLHNELKFIDDDSWYVFTDTADIRFQSKLPDLGDGDVIAVSEGMLHKDNPFWVPIIDQYPEFSNLLLKPVYNAGVWAMRGDVLTEFLHHQSILSRNYSVSYIDQLLFNTFLQSHDLNVDTHPTFATCLFDNYNKEVFKDGDKFVNAEGEPYSVVHFNGNTKKYI